MAEKDISIALIGAGMRGLYSYSPCILKHPHAEVVAVAEPKDNFRNEAARLHAIPGENVFTSWEQLLSQPKLADAVLIATSDALHKGPAIAAAKKGYHILLEKPMAPTAADCLAIVEKVKEHKVQLAVCHVLRYAPLYVHIKSIIDSGQIGKICTIQHLEGVGWWHQAHSFVRGNWRNSQESSFMLLAKSCHDLDMLHWWAGCHCLNVSSFGYLKHFCKSNKPLQAAPRCMECPLADQECPYSAKTFYFGKLKNQEYGWPLAIMISEITPKALEEALRTGPYGRCVYDCDNDVVDHQVVAMEFENQITINFTMTAFTPGGRRSRIMGTMGYLECDDRLIRVFDFKTARWTEYDMEILSDGASGMHGGGDSGVVNTFIDAIIKDDSSLIKTGADETLHSHLLAFAAEQSRVEKRMVQMDAFLKQLGRM
jgi:predicted dehydrogenase